MKCQICNNKEFQSLGNHLRLTHKINIKDYYDKYLKTNGEGLCENCGKPTSFNSCLTGGYRTYCSNKCFYSQKRMTKIKHTNMLKYSAEFPIQCKRISEKIFNKAMRSKKYLLPSKKEIYIKGYEPQFLDYIFERSLLGESDIDYSPKGIKYTRSDNTKHYYYPDFYIPKLNLIVEIKSTWTEIADKNTEIKKEATIKAGFNYLRIVDNNFEEFDYTLSQHKWEPETSSL